eukprot:782800-Amphidinium_carterae.1
MVNHPETSNNTQCAQDKFARVCQHALSGYISFTAKQLSGDSGGPNDCNLFFGKGQYWVNGLCNDRGHGLDAGRAGC